MRVPIQINVSNTSSGLSDIIRLLTLIIYCLAYKITQSQQEIESLSKENLELKVKLNRIGRVFAPKNEQTFASENGGTQKPKRKRGGQPGHKANARNIPKVLPKKEIIIDLEEIPLCKACDKPYVRISAFDKVSNQISATISAIHEWETFLVKAFYIHKFFYQL